MRSSQGPVQAKMQRRALQKKRNTVGSREWVRDWMRKNTDFDEQRIENILKLYDECEEA